MHYFATPLRPAQQTKSKRKRGDDGADPQDGLDHDANDDPQPEIQPAPLRDRREGEQRRLAGLSSDDAFQVPGPPFPHAALKDPRPRFTSSHVQHELAGLSPAIYAPATSTRDRPAGERPNAPALRTTHLNVLSTVMHRCLLEGDYERAARAWGMIMRTQAHGMSIEPRYNGLWGLGAELLLHRKSSNSIFWGNEQAAPSNDEYPYTEEGFQLAKDYYERLILQYPVRIYQPNAIDATTFYPPLFSVWIMQVLERSRRTRRSLRREYRDHHSDADMSVDGHSGMNSSVRRTRIAEIQHEELAGAREICRRIQELVQSPPYDKNMQLLVLRGHVGLWLSDLLLDKTVTHELDDQSDDDADDESDLEEESDFAEKSRKRSESLQEAQQAKLSFEAASRIAHETSNGLMIDFDKEIRNINKRIQELKTSHN